MNNSSIAKVRDSIAQLLELKGENAFNIRAYQRAAKVIEGLQREPSAPLLSLRLAGI